MLLATVAIIFAALILLSTPIVPPLRISGLSGLGAGRRPLRGCGAGAGHLPEVGVGGVQVAKAGMDRGQDVAAGAAAHHRAVAHLHRELGRDDDVLSAVAEGLAEVLL